MGCIWSVCCFCLIDFLWDRLVVPGNNTLYCPQTSCVLAHRGLAIWRWNSFIGCERHRFGFCFPRSLWFRVGVGKCGMETKSSRHGPSPAAAISSSSATMEVSSCDRLHSPQSLKHLLTGSLQRKFADSWSLEPLHWPLITCPSSGCVPFLPGHSGMAGLLHSICLETSLFFCFFSFVKRKQNTSLTSACPYCSLCLGVSHLAVFKVSTLLVEGFAVFLEMHISFQT